jgi:hypothetical protein
MLDMKEPGCGPAAASERAPGATRPGDLPKTIRLQNLQDRRLNWTVLRRTLRRVEDEVYGP